MVDEQLAVSITSPADGAVIRRDDDVGAAAGIQVDVVVRAEGVRDGTAIVIDTSANPVALDSALVEDGEAVFSAFTLPRGEITLHAATATCHTPECFASVALTVVDSDAVVTIAKPTEGEVVPAGDVELSVVRESGAPPRGCRIDVDGRGIGNFVWEDQARPLTVASSLPAGEHTVQAFCAEGLDVVPTQRVTFSVGGVTAESIAFSAVQPLFTRAHGDVVGARLVTKPGFGVIASVSGGRGGTVVLAHYAAASGGAPFASVSRVLGEGEHDAAFEELVLPQGVSYVEAVYTDVAGNVASTPRQKLVADFIGPTLVLGVRTAAGAAQDCDSAATACLADTRELDAGRIGLDRAASDAVCAFGPCSALGTDLVFSLADCVNSDPSSETCPVTIRLQSRKIGDTAWADVFGGAFGSGDTPDSPMPADPRFDPAVTRELRLVTEDSNGNTGVSNSVFLMLNFSGSRIDEVERLDAALAPTGDALTDDRYYGIAESIIDPASGELQTSFRVRLTAYDVTPTSVRLAVDSASGGSAYEVPVIGGAIADFVGVAFAVATDPAHPTTNTVTVQVMCGPDPCGQRAYAGVVADIEAPTYEFSRCSLCDNGVPLVSSACPAACAGPDGDPGANIAGAGHPAIWNIARDLDHDGGNGFDARPIVVRMSGVEEGSVIRLVTDLGSLGNATASATGCPGAATCSAAFPDLTASHLPGSEARRISVSFTDRAGNVAVPKAARIDANHESIYARTDVIAPRGVAADVCIGESTGSDAASVEAGTCAAVCAETGVCNRTQAAATLSWSAPGDDDDAGTVTGYFIGVAALGIDYAGAVYTDCAQLASGVAGYERVASLLTPPRTGGAAEHLALSGLYPHRDYCVVVAATDDAGNEGPRTVVTRRKIPLVTVPTRQPFDGVVRDDAQPAGAFRSEPAAPRDYGAFATSLPDLDADGRDDFAITQLTSGSVQLFLSGSAGGAFAPAVTINAPAIAYSGSFGAAVAGGDFDGDGLHDLVICDPTLTTTGFAEAGARGGALFLYYGVLGSGIARDVNTTTPQVPSLHPDVSLLGAAGQELCANLHIADVDGDARADLVATTSAASNAARGYIIAGGDRARFAGGAAYFDVTTDPDAVLLAAPGAAAFPHRLAVGDFDADGQDETVISDADHLYVYDAASLTSTLTLTPGVGFGNALAAVRSPGGATGDWLLVGTTDDRVVVLAPGFTSASSPLDPAAYATLDGTDWSGAPAARFGRSLASLGNFDDFTGADIAVGPGAAESGGPYATFVYSFDETTGAFEKRAILQGGAGFGGALVGVRAYEPGSQLGRGQLLVVQRFAARLFMFR